MKYNDANILFQSYIEDVFSNLEEFLLSLKEGHSSDAYTILKSVSDAFTIDVLRTSIRTQICLKEKFFGDDVENEYSTWASTSEAYKVVRKQYPELIRVLEVKKKNFIAYIKSVLKRFSEEYFKARSSCRKQGGGLDHFRWGLASEGAACVLSEDRHGADSI